jgi:predicted DNA-binding protein (UPF0251 family)
MKPQEFDSTSLPRKLSMREHEAARLVLVHNATVEKAAEIYNLSAKQLREVIAMFNGK